MTKTYYAETTGARIGEPHYNADADVDQNGIINFRDRILRDKECNQ